MPVCDRSRGYRSDRPLVRKRSRFILSPKALLRVPSLRHPRVGFRRLTSLPRFRPSSRHHRARPPAASDPHRPLRSVHRLSQPLDGLLRASASRVCFTPRATSRVPHRPGDSPSAQPYSVSRARCPLVVGRLPLTPPRCRKERCHVGLASTSRLCSMRRSVRSIWCYPRRTSLPSSGCPPPGAASRAQSAGPPSPPPVVFVLRRLRFPARDLDRPSASLRLELVVDSSPLRRDPLEVSTSFAARLDLRRRELRFRSLPRIVMGSANHQAHCPYRSARERSQACSEKIRSIDVDFFGPVERPVERLWKDCVCL